MTLRLALSLDDEITYNNDIGFETVVLFEILLRHRHLHHQTLIALMAVLLKLLNPLRLQPGRNLIRPL